MTLSGRELWCGAHKFRLGLTRFARHLKADLAEAIAQGRLVIEDVELAADIVIGVWLQVTRGSLERRATSDLTRQTLDAVLRALGVPQSRNRKSSSSRRSRISPRREGANHYGRNAKDE